MAKYTINYASTGDDGGKSSINISPTDIDKSTSITLPGQGRVNYGEFFDTNILQMMEHFAKNTPPYAPTTGQVWYRTSDKALRYYIGNTQIDNLDDNNAHDGWIRLASITGTQPTNPYCGQTYYEKTTNKLMMWNCSSSSWESLLSGSTEFVKKSGDTMSGNLRFTNNKTVTDLPNPTASSDAANKAYVDAAVATLNQAVNDLTSRLLGFKGVPQGAIIMWSGAYDDVPSGWRLCDGTNGTPNLVSRFIIGAGAGLQVGATGGNVGHTHNLTINNHVLSVDEIPPHTHTYTTMNGGGSMSVAGGRSNLGIFDFQSSSTGGGQGHNHTGSASNASNLPPFYALAYIIKL